jgi:dolichol-phosphate mannosyltransferase
MQIDRPADTFEEPDAPPPTESPDSFSRPSARAAFARTPELSIIVPTYCEHGNVAELVARVRTALDGVLWEVIFVDDDSPDGTAHLVRTLANSDHRIRCIRRVGRRGLAGACIEGILSSSAPIVAVMDADLQHDETILPQMLRAIRNGSDIVVASRYLESAREVEGLSPIRRWGSEVATGLAAMVIGRSVTDPMSGFFMLRREIVETHAPVLAGEGYKLLMDILWAAGKSVDITEISYGFRERRHGESKLDTLVTADYLGLLFSKLSGGVLPVRFLMFGLVGLSGIAVHLLILNFALSTLGLGFEWSQFAAVMVAMTWNFVVNNRLTYRDARLRGGSFFVGLLKFYLACSIGSVGNVGVASWIYSFHATAWLAGLAGAVMGAVFNYAISSALIWKRK